MSVSYTPNPSAATAYVADVTPHTYTGLVKTITITIPDELDAEAAAEARRRGISKSELIRRGLAAVLPAQGSVSGDDPWHDLAGFAGDDLTTTPGEIDRVLYER